MHRHPPLPWQHPVFRAKSSAIRLFTGETAGNRMGMWPMSARDNVASSSMSRHPQHRLLALAIGVPSPADDPPETGSRSDPRTSGASACGNTWLTWRTRVQVRHRLFKCSWILSMNFAAVIPSTTLVRRKALGSPLAQPALFHRGQRAAPDRSRRQDRRTRGRDRWP